MDMVLLLNTKLLLVRQKSADIEDQHKILQAAGESKQIKTSRQKME